MAKIGRPKGSVNKKTAAMLFAQRKGISPLEFLLNIMDDAAKDLSIRMDAAKSAAPYCHQRLAQLAVEHTGNVNITKLERTIVHIDNSDSESIPTSH
jgi:NADH dehydrogenase FAD-containing subunit